jgi:hypothetical protein
MPEESEGREDQKINSDTLFYQWLACCFVASSSGCWSDTCFEQPNNLLSDKYVAISNIAGYYD